jgi:hypothetical protein
MKNSILLILLLTACSTAGRITLSYHASVDKNNAEAAWSRAIAYSCRLSLLRGDTPVVAGDSMIKAGDAVITREYNDGGVIIRASKSIALPSHPEGKVPPEIKKELADERERLQSLLEYVKTGRSLLMTDLDIPRRYEVK